MNTTDKSQFKIGDYVQMVNHSEPKCNGLYGHISDVDSVRGNIFYEVRLEDVPDLYCIATDDELMEG